uniref:ATP synthase F0 subunit 8 n=1 Tax=Glycinde armigera TaxID=397552 RepID=A0A0U2W0Y1_9ANNE|nr:ATP synthase F0 subunit 8 [Glycinde armigera]
MPHLSPMSWIMAPLMFYFTLMLFISCLWWIQTPKFPLITYSFSVSSPKWMWN